MIPKFRAWDNDNSQWYKPTYRAFEDNLEYLEVGFEGRLSMVTKIDGQIKILDESCFDGRFELMQSTGLMDKNAVEIYESDIVRIWGFNESFISLVKNHTIYNYPAFDVETPDDWHFEANVLSTVFEDDDYQIEVIGNVYEHQHLLKEDNS